MPTLTFSAALERMPGRLGWTIIRVPFDISKKWGMRGQTRVKGQLNGYDFSGVLFPTKSGQHFLLVNKKLHKMAGVSSGSLARLRIERDTAKREIQKSPELDRVLKQSSGMRKWYEALSDSYRGEITRWICEAKSPGVRAKRADQMAERIMETMEAEKELPPMIKMVFAVEPNAIRGWAKMTSIQRRGELFGIFYYRTPDSRARRAAKAAIAAAETMEKFAD